MVRQLRDLPPEPRAARLLTQLCAAAFAAAVAATPSAAGADAWTPVTFTGPTGATAHGLAIPSAGDASVRLLIGCEGGAKDAWRGIALLEAAPFGPTPEGGSGQTEISTAFFGRAPVSSSWKSRVTSDGLLSWPAASDDLRRTIVREDQTRGQATLHLVIHRGATRLDLAFGVDGLGARGAEVASQCGGWGATDTPRRRERGW